MDGGGDIAFIRGVQIGNEVDAGILWDDGRVADDDFTNLGRLLKAGHDAAKACDKDIGVVVHTATTRRGARRFYDNLRAQGVRWDITGLSYYCGPHGTPANMAEVVSGLRSRHGKPVIIVETAFPYTTADADSTPNLVSTGCAHHPATPAGQQAHFAAVQTAAHGARAAGVFYWEPTWYAVPGNGWDPADIDNSGNQWDNMAVFDHTGRLNPHIRWLSFPAGPRRS